MKISLILIAIFMSIFGVDSLIELRSTIPLKNTFPALILKRVVFADPAVPNDIVREQDGIEKLKFESIDKKLKVLENRSISYVCPSTESTELVHSETPQCENELQVTSYRTGDSCESGQNKEEHNIGYGLLKKHNIFSIRKKSEKIEYKVQYPLYVSCFDKEKKIAHHVKYELMSQNQLYFRSSNIYPEEQRDEISKLHLEFLKKMAVQFGISPDNIFHEGYNKSETNNLIPFQLVSHEDMILHNWKLATFNEMNYSLIWSNIANNAWKKINVKLRNIMKKSNNDLDVYSGVHDYTEKGYPRYLWKFIHRYLGGIVIVIHNHSENDTENYEPLCTEPDNNCEVYGFASNEENKNKGYTYCCVTKTLKEKIPFFKKNFMELETLRLTDLFSVDDLYDPTSQTLIQDKPPSQSSSSKPNSYVSEPNPINPNRPPPNAEVTPEILELINSSNTSAAEKNRRNHKQSIPRQKYEIKQSDVESLQKKLQFDKPTSQIEITAPRP